MTNRSDNFTRANSATSLGTPSDGGSAWVVVNGTWGISSNQGYCAVDAGGQNLAILETSVTDGTYAITAPAANAGGIVFRYVDSSNYWLLAFPGGDAQLYKNVAGSFTSVQLWTSAAPDGVTISLALSGDTVTVTANGTPLSPSITMGGVHAAGTKIGLRTFAVTSPRFTALSFTGVAPPPTLTSPTGSATGSTTATIGATTDTGSGTLYGVVTTSLTTPTAAQVKAGQNAAGATATFAGSVAVSSSGAKAINATGLTASTTYYAHLVHNAAGGDSNVVSSTSFTTSAGASSIKARRSAHSTGTRAGSRSI